MVLDWFFGENYHPDKSSQWLTEPTKLDRDAAPILKLNSAIVQQAISDRADRIDLWIGVSELDYPTVESPDHYAARIERENAAKNPSTSNAEFARVMAKAGIDTSAREREAISEDTVTVFYTFGEFRFAAMTIPASLVMPIIRAYPYSFNYRLCSSTARPENLLYVATKESAGFASIDHYDRAGDHKLGICLEYEE